jgi:hypothetical protein
MRRTLLSLAVIALWFASPASAWTTSAEYCNAFAADRAAGRPGGAYDVAQEGLFMAAYRDCMRAYQIMLPIWWLPPRDKVRIAVGADVAKERNIPWIVSWAEGQAVVDEDHHAYCAAKYKSYNPSTGMFLSYSGVWKPCR